MFLHEEAINIFELSNGIRIKTFQKALTRKAGLLCKQAIAAVTKSAKLDITKSY